jgi:hypothetical protein
VVGGRSGRVDRGRGGLGDVLRDGPRSPGCRVAVSAQLRRSVGEGVGDTGCAVVPREVSAEEEAAPSGGMAFSLAVTGSRGPGRLGVPSPNTAWLGGSVVLGMVRDPASIVRHWPGGASALGCHRPNLRRSPITTQGREVRGLGGWASIRERGGWGSEGSCALLGGQPSAPGGSTGRFWAAALPARGRNWGIGATAEGAWGGSNPIPGMGSRRLGWVEPNSGDGKPDVGANLGSCPRSPRAVGWSWRPTLPTAVGGWVVLEADRGDRRRRSGGLGARPCRPPSAVGWSWPSEGRPPSAWGWSWRPTGPTAVGVRVLLGFRHPNCRRRSLQGRGWPPQQPSAVAQFDRRGSGFAGGRSCEDAGGAHVLAPRHPLARRWEVSIAERSAVDLGLRWGARRRPGADQGAGLRGGA